MRVYAQFMKDGDLCFDVGAHFGTRTDVFLRLGASVVAIEPQDVCIATLRRTYGRNQRVTLVQAALGEQEGQQEMTLSNAPAVSSLSPSWIDAVKASGRFPKCEWTETVTVPVTTLDALIARYGQPAFIKVDVEGFEDRVFAGLSQPVPAISFEYTPEFISAAIGSIRHLATLGRVRFNRPVDEPAGRPRPQWIDADAMCNVLSALPPDTAVDDLYARFEL